MLADLFQLGGDILELQSLEKENTIFTAVYFTVPSC